jgi:hypothetical protein
MQPGLSGNPFLLLEKRGQKRLGTEDGKAAQIILFEIIEINQKSDPNYNPVPAPRSETVFVE